MPSLVLSNNSAQNPLTIDLSSFLNLQDGSGTDPADPAFTNRVFTRSLLKEGATLSLTQYVEKELTFPLLLNAVNNSALAVMIEQINQVIETTGATYSWQDDGLSQPTVFDGLSGVLEIQYSYRKAQKFWTAANLRLFAQPFGHAASSRPYAAASAVGPLLMISPYASGGALAIGASTQAGVAGFGGQQQGASSGIFYSGSPSLAGDAGALLQVSYCGPSAYQSPPGRAHPPAVIVAQLPDAHYNPLITMPECVRVGGSFFPGAGVVASQYISAVVSGGFTVPPPVFAASAGVAPTAAWAGQHRIFAIARASQNTGTLTLTSYDGQANTAVSVGNPDWGLVDLGTIGLRASEIGRAHV